MSDAIPDLFYVRQTADIHPEDIRMWFAMCSDEAREEGATFCRFSVDDHENPKAAIVEGWKKEPKDQGDIRWALTSKSKVSNEQ